MIFELIYVTDHLLSACSFSQKNQLIANLSMLDSLSLYRLHTIYCMNLYGCELLNYNSRYINVTYISWHKGIRKLLLLFNIRNGRM